MEIFLYEFMTSGGLWTKPDWGEPESSLVSEGLLMLRAITDDFARIPHLRITGMWDQRLDCKRLPPSLNVSHVHSMADHDRLLDRSLREADVVMVIAPELDRILESIVQRIPPNKFALNPLGEFVRITADKWLSFQTFQQAGIPTPPTSLGNKIDLSVVCGFQTIVQKLRWGAGSQAMSVIPFETWTHQPSVGDNEIIQPWLPGRPASVSFLCGPNQRLALPAMWQSIDGKSFEYLGGSKIEEDELTDRAHRLASQALDALPPATGYVGVDLLLGATADDDYVVEVNPRLTTSYVGLRQLSTINLAWAMWKIAEGLTVSGSWNANDGRFRVADKTQWDE
ncbi:MAG: ATP-grasp domain-containing protein [Pirellulaceae bacterium]